MRLIKVIIIIASVMLLSSCELFNRVFKSGDRHTKGKTYGEIYDKALEFYDAERYDKAYSLFDNIETAFAGDNKLDTIMFYKAQCKYFNRNYIESSELYNYYRTTMGRGVFAEMADLYFALSLYHVSPDVQLDQTYTERAINAFKDFAYRNEGHEMIPQCEEYIDELQQRMYESDVSIAQTYFRIGQYNSCIVALQNILQNNPHTPYREKIMFMTVEASFAYARSSIDAKKRERFYDVIDGFFRFVEEYPNSKFLKDAKRYQTFAEDFAAGKAYVHDVTGRLITERDDIYDERDRLEDKLQKLEKGKRDKKIEQVSRRLDVVNRAISKFEEAADKRTRDVKINQAR